VFNWFSESLVHNRDHVTVATEDLDAFDAELSDKIRKSPADYLPLVRYCVGFSEFSLSVCAVDFELDSRTWAYVVRDGCVRGSRKPPFESRRRDRGDGGASPRRCPDLSLLQGELPVHEICRGQYSVAKKF
jgi:hypothetical protein